MSDLPELKPCPFCGSDDLKVLDMDGHHYILCYGCIRYRGCRWYRGRWSWWSLYYNM